MPQQPLIASERARMSVIAVVMLAILVVSLGLAYGLVVLPAPPPYDLTLGEPQHVGSFTIRAPQGWRSTDLGDGFKEFESSARFSDRHNAARQMIVGSLVFTRPQPALEALKFLLATKLRPGGKEGTLAGPAIRELQVGRLVGLRYTDAVQAADGIQERFVAVMTADGRRQWIVILTQPVESPSLLKERILVDDQAFEKICDTATLPAAAESEEQQPKNEDKVKP